MKISIRYAFVLVFLFSGTIVFSQEEGDIELTDYVEDKKHPLLSDKFSFYAGVYSSTKTVKIGANGTSANEIINFNEKFNFDDNETTLFLYFNWRFAKKWSLSAEYFGIKNANSVSLEEEFEWEDNTYIVGGFVKAGFNLKMYRVMFSRTISKGLKHELGVGLGVHTLETEVFIEGNAYVDDIADAEIKRSLINVVAPLPNIGAWYFYAPTDKLLLSSRIDWFGISVGEYSGTLWNFSGGVNYQFIKHFGIGLSYKYFDFTATVDKEDWNGKLSLIFHGPSLTLNANF